MVVVWLKLTTLTAGVPELVARVKLEPVRVQLLPAVASSNLSVPTVRAASFVTSELTVRFNVLKSATASVALGTPPVQLLFVPHVPLPFPDTTFVHVEAEEPHSRVKKAKKHDA